MHDILSNIMSFRPVTLLRTREEHWSVHSSLDKGFDCVTTNPARPERDRHDILAWIREHQPDVGVIMLTAHGEVEVALERVRAGTSAFLVKDTRVTVSMW